LEYQSPIKEEAPMVSPPPFRVLALALAGSTLLSAGHAQEGDVRGITPEKVARLVKLARPGGPEAWTRIPWVASLAAAREISRKEDRPVFLFALLGNLARNRC
jgi:hypothetical protein